MSYDLVSASCVMLQLRVLTMYFFIDATLQGYLYNRIGYSGMLHWFVHHACIVFLHLCNCLSSVDFLFLVDISKIKVNHPNVFSVNAIYITIGWKQPDKMQNTKASSSTGAHVTVC